MRESILQFGGGKFLRCFADLFVHELNAGRTAADLHGVIVIQSTAGTRAEQLNRQQGRYHVAIRGLCGRRPTGSGEATSNTRRTAAPGHHIGQELPTCFASPTAMPSPALGQAIDRIVEVAGIRRGLTAAGQWPDVLAAARSPELELIVSNTTEAGFALTAGDAPDDAPPQSFPAKLLAVLRERFRAGLSGVTILPCELLDRNAERLRDLALQQAGLWSLPRDFLAWLREACRWRSTLVDRIVSSPPPGDPLAAQDPLFAVAEPFALWLVEGADDVPVFNQHPVVQRVARLEPYALRKVRILNGAHTALVAKALPLGVATVRQAVADAAIGRWLRELLFDEIVPTLSGRVDQPEQFAADTLQRFANPYLEHRLADIALHHATKLDTRLRPSYEEYCARFGRAPPRLAEALGLPP